MEKKCPVFGRVPAYLTQNELIGCSIVNHQSEWVILWESTCTLQNECFLKEKITFNWNIDLSFAKSVRTNPQRTPQQIEE